VSPKIIVTQMELVVKAVGNGYSTNFWNDSSVSDTIFGLWFELWHFEILYAS